MVLQKGFLIMPTRYLKPGIRDSGHIEMLSDCPDAENLYYRLLATVDDFGRFDGRGDMIKANCFPIRRRVTADICIQLLAQLQEADLLIQYVVDGKQYLQIKRWDNKPRAEKSKFPPVPADVYNCPQMLPVTVTVTVTDVPEPKPKPKEEREKPKTPAADLPDWLPLDHWRSYLAMRVKIKKPATVRAQGMLIARLAKLREEGYMPQQCLAEAELHCWQSVYAPKDAIPQPLPIEQPHKGNGDTPPWAQSPQGIQAMAKLLDLQPTATRDEIETEIERRKVSQAPAGD
jgi:hypothetical protein